jgi:predicted lipoprotein
VSAAAQPGARAPARRSLRPRLIGVALVVGVIAAMALDTTYREAGETSATGRPEFDPARYGAETYPKAVAAIEDAAVPLPRLAAAMRRDLDAAGERYGKRQGTGPYTFSTTGAGTAGKAEGGLLPVRVKGVPEGTTVSLQIGPAINGTAIRDAAGFIEFGQFTNQVEYAAAGTALNAQVKQQVLAGIEPGALEGRRVSFTGAFSSVTPSVITITPIELEPGA